MRFIPFYLLFLCLGFSLYADDGEEAKKQAALPSSSHASPKEKKDPSAPSQDKKEGADEKTKERPEAKKPEELANKKNEEKKGEKQEEKEEKKASPHKLTGSVTFISDYRSRGISQTMCRPAVQGELKYTHRSGFYFKSWASNVDGTTHFINNTSMEWDFYIGLQRPLCQTDLKYDIGFLIYYYPGGQAFVPAHVRYDSVEYYVGFSYKGFNAKLYLMLTDYFGVNSENPPFNWEDNRLARPNGHSYGSPYLEANYEWLPFDKSKWKLSFHVGYQGVINYPEISYVDWQVGYTYSFDWFDFSLYYIDTNAKHDFYDIPDNAYKPRIRRLGAATLVAGITRSF